MNILLIEDEPNIISLIKRGLEESGYSITVAMDGNSGFDIALKHSFDVILLDIMLPGKNGHEVCKELRTNSITTPIIMLTALNSTENIVNGLDIGADDYITKPFKLKELEARIRNILRRQSSLYGLKEVDVIYQIADLKLNDTTKLVLRGKDEINLTATEYRLLLYLIKNQNKVVSRMDLLENVWDIDFNMGTNVVDVYINYLRKKIDQKYSNKLLQTVFGMGYTLKDNNEDKK